jgi:hypothetical protein
MFYYVSCGFHVVPKHHYFMHMPEHVTRGGLPKSFWVYSEESKNTEAKRMFNRCSKGHSVIQQILLRFEWVFALKRLL